MPPGNNNAKPTGRRRCDYCRRESCRGDNCAYIPFERERLSQLSYNSEDSSLRSKPIVTASSAGQAYNIGYAVKYSEVPQSQGSLQPIQSPTTVHHAEKNQIGAKTIPESKVQDRGYTNETTSTATSQREGAFDVSKPTKELKTYTAYGTTSGPVQSEKGVHQITYEPFVPSSSTYVAIDKKSAPPIVKTDKVEHTNPSVPINNNKLGENKKYAMKPQLASTKQECLPIVETNKMEIKMPQHSDFKADDGMIPLVSKPSSCTSVISKSSSNSDEGDKTNVKRPKPHHSPKALTYEGVVYEILNSHSAKVRVAERNEMPIKKLEWGAVDAVHKFAFLAVSKILQDDNESFYSSNTHITSVVSPGDLLIVICTPHNNQKSGYELFVHEAKKNDSVRQWLDANNCTLKKNETSKMLKFITGCHYVGKVVEMRLPYAFVVEVYSNDDKQTVFVFSTHFHPQGINSPAMAQGISLKYLVNIGDEIVVIPYKNPAMQDNNKFEWIAGKAWPKNVLTPLNLNFSDDTEPPIFPLEKLILQEKTDMKNSAQQQDVESLAYIQSFYPSAKNWKEFDGVILSLQYDWGIVKEAAVGNQSAYVFTRENTFLFGVCLQHFILDNILQEGQLVKFSRDTKNIEDMNALAVWCGDKLPSYSLFEESAANYCQERKIMFSTEELLILHGKLLYVGK